MLARIERILRRLLLASAKKGPYRFLISKFEKTPFKLAQDVLSTEYFKDESTPIELPFDSFNKFMVIAPHQDDETIGLGGTLLKLRDAGKDINIVYVTDGAQPTHPYGREKTIEIRSKEAKKVCDILGAKIHNLNISNDEPVVLETNLKQLSDIIHEVKPEIVFIPWLLDSPPKHRLSNHILEIADRLFKLPNYEIWGYQVHNMLYPNGYVDVTSQIEEKRKLLEIFESQNTFFQSYDHLTIGMNAWNSRFMPFENSSKPRYTELFFTLPKEDYFKLINKFYYKSLKVTYGTNLACYNCAKSMVNLA